MGCETTQVADGGLPTVDILSRPDCHLCDEAKALLRELQSSHAFVLRETDITARAELLERYGSEIPVVFVNGRKLFKYRVDAEPFVRALRRARQRRWRLPWAAGAAAEEPYMP